MLVRLCARSTNPHSQSLRLGRSPPGRGRAYRPHLERLEKRELLDGSAAGVAYGQIPLSFEANQGQTDPAVQFLSRGSGYALFLTSQEAVLSLSKPVAPKAGGAAEQAAAPVEDLLRLQLVGANAAPRVAGLQKLPGTVNYFLGNNPAQWRTNVSTYGKVAYQGVYPGIDLVYYGNQRQLEYDFVVGPGADPGVIRLSFKGAQDLTLDAKGNLVLHTAGGDVVEHAPVVYQEGTGSHRLVSGRYVLVGADRVGFQVDAYDASRPLVIDPVLSYSTYLGGSGDDKGNGIAVDASGNAYVTGVTDTNFPTTPGAVQAISGGGADAFVVKLNATGTALIYATYLGGSGNDGGFRIAVDGSGNAYVTGSTSSSNFPTTPGAFQSTLGNLSSVSTNAFVAKLNATGTALLYSTYGDLINADPLLGILWDNGGPTPTMALLPGSPAIDAGDNTNASAYDQRGPGFSRIVAGAIDIGAFEVQSGRATHFQVSAPTQVTSNTPFDVTVRALDDYGRTAIGYFGTAGFLSRDQAPGVVLPAAYTFTAQDGGVHTFTAGVVLVTPGNQTLIVTDDLGTYGSATILVTAPEPPPGSGGGQRVSEQSPGVGMTADAFSVGTAQTVPPSDAWSMVDDEVDQRDQQRATDVLFGKWQRMELRAADRAPMEEYEELLSSSVA